MVNINVKHRHANTVTEIIPQVENKQLGQILVHNLTTWESPTLV